MLKPFLVESNREKDCRPDLISIPLFVVLTLLTAWVFLPQLTSLWVRWCNDPGYSHGFFVPILAALIAWCRIEECPADSTKSSKQGLLFVLIGMVALAVGARIYFDWLQQAALLPVIFGIILLVGGKWLGTVTWPSVLFLLFMIPLPFFVETAMASPLQTLAGQCSTFLLQTVGIAAIRTGNLIDVEGHVLGVAEACSGLRILVVFFAIATSIALLIRRSWLQKLILIVSAVPIALFCNVLRITATGLLYVYAGPELAEKVFHDFAGWLMMPIALAMIFVELKYLNLVIEESWGQSAKEGQTSASVFGSPV